FMHVPALDREREIPTTWKSRVYRWKTSSEKLRKVELRRSLGLRIVRSLCLSVLVVKLAFLHIRRYLAAVARWQRLSTHPIGTVVTEENIRGDLIGPIAASIRHRLIEFRPDDVDRLRGARLATHRG